MIELSDAEFRKFQGAGGTPFTELMDDILGAIVSKYGVSREHLSTNQATAIPDGGVDTVLGVPIPGAEYLECETVWQYKATKSGGLAKKALLKECKKEYASRLIKAGHGYRLAVCREMTARRKASVEKTLLAIVHDINPLARAPKVIAISDLRRLLSDYYSLKIKYFRNGLVPFKDISAWAVTQRAVTHTFVQIPAWDNTATLIRQHCSLANSSDTGMLTVFGEAGTGKSRFVFETLNADPELAPLVVSTTDDKEAVALARYLALNPLESAILVADDCSRIAALQIDQELASMTKRVRVVAIQNPMERTVKAGKEVWIEKIGDVEVRKVLDANFPGVPFDRRSHYADICEGFIRFAAEMCRMDGRIAAVGHLGPAKQTVEDIVRARLSPSELDAVCLISLVSKVGYRDEVKAELEKLCEIVGLNFHTVVSAAVSIKDSPGFIVQAGRYLYVSPEIVARVGFELASARWVSPDSSAFMSSLPAVLVERFVARAKTSAIPGVAYKVTSFFNSWALGVEPSELRDRVAVDRFLNLLEMQPAKFLPVLRELVNSIPCEELQAGKYSELRRATIFVLERAVSHSQYFTDAEDILFRLAANESEEYSNNATGVWTQLFNLFHSGVPVSYEARMELLRGRARSSVTEAETMLVVQAAISSMSQPRFKRSIAPAFGGAIAEHEWNPETWEQVSTCMDLAVTVLVEIRNRASPRIVDCVHKGFVESVDDAVRAGAFDVASRMQREMEFDKKSVAEYRVALREVARRFKKVESVDSELLTRLDHLIEASKPVSESELFLELITRDRWSYARADREDLGIAEFRQIVELVKSDTSWTELVVGTVTAPGAKSTWILGRALAVGLEGNEWILDVFPRIARQPGVELIVGYLTVQKEWDESSKSRLSVAINRVSQLQPEVAAEVLFAADHILGAKPGIFALVEAGRLSLDVLSRFVYGRDQSQQELAELAGFALQQLKSNNQRNASGFVEALGTMLASNSSEFVAKAKYAPLQKALWELVTNVKPGAKQDAEGWVALVRSLGEFNSKRSAGILARSLLSSNFSLVEAAGRALSELARNDGLVVLEQFYAAAKSRDGWKLRVHVERRIFENCGVEVVESFLGQAGREGALAIARHLPRMYLGDAGEPLVPPITELVLERYGDDEKVFAEFVAGFHSMQASWGPYHKKLERDREFALLFVRHSCSAVRKWARLEVESIDRSIDKWRQDDAESRID
jgi:hypothetical protein